MVVTGGSMCGRRPSSSSRPWWCSRRC